jgi:hypothetical protein
MKMIQGTTTGRDNPTSSKPSIMNGNASVFNP